MMALARLRPKLDAVLGSKRNPRSLPYPKASLASPGSTRSLAKPITAQSPQTTVTNLARFFQSHPAGRATRKRANDLDRMGHPGLFGTPRPMFVVYDNRLPEPGKEDG